MTILDRRRSPTAGPRQALRSDRGRARRVVRRPAGRAVRPARHQRRRQDHHRRDPPGPAPVRRRAARSSASTRRRPATACAAASAPSCRTPPCPTGCGSARRCGCSRRCTPPPPARRARRGVGPRPPAAAPPFGALSGGERQRLFVALALVGRPELVFLDELTQNLDPVGRRHTWDVVRQVRDGARRSCSSPTTSRRPSGCATASS